MLPHAPGVQMQAIPEDAVQEDSGDEEEEDPNKRVSSKNLHTDPSSVQTARRESVTCSNVTPQFVLVTRG